MNVHNLLFILLEIIFTIFQQKRKQKPKKRIPKSFFKFLYDDIRNLENDKIRIIGEDEFDRNEERVCGID